MNASIFLFLLTAAFAAFAVIFTLPRVVMGPFVKAYPYITGVFALAYLLGFAATPYIFDKFICAAMLVICAVAIENRLSRDEHLSIRSLQA